MIPRRALPLLLAVLATSRCFCLLLPQGGLGERCSASTDCYLGLVCVLMDEDNPDSNHVCMPPVSFDVTSCDIDADCEHEGMPIEAWCTPEQRCTCESLMDNAQLSCEAGTTPGRFACACVSVDQGAAGDSCGHPEECETLMCDGERCLEQCDSNDDCGGPFTACAEGDCVE